MCIRDSFINYNIFVFMSVLGTWSSCIITQYGSLILLHSENGRPNLSDRYCFVNALALSEFISKTFEQLPAIVTHCWRFALINSSISWMIMEADMLKLDVYKRQDKKIWSFEAIQAKKQISGFRYPTYTALLTIRKRRGTLSSSFLNLILLNRADFRIQQPAPVV